MTMIAWACSDPEPEHGFGSCLVAEQLLEVGRHAQHRIEAGHRQLPTTSWQAVWDLRRSVMTLPVATSRAANRSRVPLRT